MEKVQFDTGSANLWVSQINCIGCPGTDRYDPCFVSLCVCVCVFVSFFFFFCGVT